MQSLATYSFSADVSDAVKRFNEVNLLVEKWLTAKGATDSRSTQGDFESLTGDGTGAFERTWFESTTGVATEVELIETTHSGATFVTTLEIVRTSERVEVFVSLSAAPGAAVVAPMKISPRCPFIVRTLVERYGDWHFSGQVLPVGLPFDATTSLGVKHLCSALRAADRKLPVVVISLDEDEATWFDLHTAVAHDLIGLADVAFVSAESSWAMTDELGARDSCFLGAVRLYWPVVRPDGHYESITWVASRLAVFGDGEQGRNRFQAALRRVVMSTAALTMVQPVSFREIRGQATKERLQALHGTARDDELDSIVNENAQLVADLEDARRTISALQWKIVSLEQVKPSDLLPADEEEHEVSAPVLERLSPEAGEMRYYKKIGSGGGVDTLVQTSACQHKSSNWRPAFKGDQAEKGLLKLEGRSDWKSLAHCSACKGGGRWRANW